MRLTNKRQHPSREAATDCGSWSEERAGNKGPDPLRRKLRSARPTDTCIRMKGRRYGSEEGRRTARGLRQSAEHTEPKANVRLPGTRNERERKGPDPLPGQEFRSQSVVVELREYSQGVVFVEGVDT